MSGAAISDELEKMFEHLRRHPKKESRTCNRCRGRGKLEAGPCAACGGDGKISSRRTQSWDPKLDRRGRSLGARR